MARISAPPTDRRYTTLKWVNRIFWILVITMAAGLVSLVFFHEQLALHFFGPPKVAMSEAYAGTGSPDARFDHVLLDQLLKEHVDEIGMVDYRGLRRDRRKLDAYLDLVAKADFDGLARDGKLAMLINLYNAATLKLIVEHAPGESIRQIESAERWEARRWKLGGRTLSLEEIEHDELRAKFIEPRIHFAIVCASLSCPPLRAEAFVPERLDAQLDEQARQYHGSIQGVVIEEDARTVRLSRLYLWYENDFIQTMKDDPKSVSAYAARFSPALAKVLKSEDRWKFGWIDYDWALNAQPE